MNDTAEPLPPADREPLVTATGLGIRRGRRWLIDNVDIAIAPGEIVALIGPNGAGKTTLVRTLLGLLRPDSGTMTRRRDVAVGYVPQRVHFDPTLPLTVGRLMTSVIRHPRDRVIEALAETGMGGRLAAPVSGLSGGELQRVLLARALLCRPNLLILDEPLQGVDYSGETELYDLIARIAADRGCGILMVSHDLHLVMAATDRVVCLNGHVCCTGKPSEVVEHPEFQKLFGPALAGRDFYLHVHDHRHEPSGGASPLVPDTAPGGEGAGRA